MKAQPIVLLGGVIAAASLHAQTLTWMQRNTGISPGLLYSAAAHGNGRYLVIACGNGPTAGTFQTQAAVSTDTLTWTTSTLPTGPVVRGITFGGGLFVAIVERNASDTGHTQNVLTSPDGTSWTSRTTGSGTLWGVAFAGGRYIAVGAPNGGQNAVTSTDGTTWTRVAVGQPFTGLLGIVSHPTVNNFVAWSTAPTNEIWVTADGSTWTRVVINGAEVIHSVTYAGGTYIALSFGPPGALRLFSSPDGTTWTPGPTVGTPARFGFTGFAVNNSLASGSATVVVAGAVPDSNGGAVNSVVVGSGSLTSWTSVRLGNAEGFTRNNFAFHANGTWLVGNNITQLFTAGDPPGLIPTTPPEIVAHPATRAASVGASVAFTVTATGTGLTYQWFFNNNAIAGATSASYPIGSVSFADEGTYFVRVTNAGGTVDSNTATLIPYPATYLSNLSVRARAGSGSETLIIGATLGGEVAVPKAILVRGIGPALANFGVGDTLADPVLTVLRGATPIATNDDWGSNLLQIASLSAAVGAFSLPASSRDSALFLNNIADGGYTIQVTGKAGATGNALVELYDLAAAPTNARIASTATRLTNLSARSFGGTGSDTLIVGFNLAGTGTRRLVIRAVGPGLGAFGVSGTMSDPRLELFIGNSRIGENDNWEVSTLAAQQSVGAFGLTIGSRDAVLVSGLNPAGYTVQVTGGTTGVVLVEAYEAP